MRLLPVIACVSAFGCTEYTTDFGFKCPEPDDPVLIQPGGSGLDPELAYAVSFWRQRGYDIDIGLRQSQVTWASENDRFGEKGDAYGYVYADPYCPTTGFVVLQVAQRWWFEMRDEECSEGAVSVNAVLTHEVGHLLGLGHSDDPANIMNPTAITRQGCTSVNTFSKPDVIR